MAVMDRIAAMRDAIDQLDDCVSKDEAEALIEELERRGYVLIAKDALLGEQI
jgi:hypothetical protein